MMGVQGIEPGDILSTVMTTTMFQRVTITCEPASVQADTGVTVTPTRPSHLSCSETQQQPFVLMVVCGLKLRHFGVFS